MRNNIKGMATEQGLYVQVIMLRRKYLKFVTTDNNKNEAKFKFKGQSTRSQRWFDIEFDCIEANFNTCAPDFYKKPFQNHDYTQDTNTYKTFKLQQKMKNVWKT